MLHSSPQLSAGYSAIPPGMIANVVTCLEMRQKPKAKALRPMEQPMMLQRMEEPDLAGYRALFRAVGQNWLWLARLVMPDKQLHAILASPDVEVYTLTSAGSKLGLLELDFRQKGQCELAYFGLVPEAIGHGAGRFLMEQALRKAWDRPIGRLAVHTCTFDHPSAVGFYRRSGFVPYKFMVEVMPDPRLTGHLPREAAPHVPLADFGR
jgi:GNAT superfamily N-acetyltransferase